MVVLTAAKLPLTTAGKLPARMANAAPIATGLAPSDWVETAYVGEPHSIDMASSFEADESGAITGWEISPSQPVSINGTAMVVTPTATSATTSYTVQAKNGSALSSGTVAISMRVLAAPSTLAASGTPQALTVEVDRAVPPTQIWTHVTGGIEPYAFALLAGGPAWMKLESGHLYGKAPASPVNTSATVRVTDMRGDTVDVTVSINVIAARSRTPTYTLQASDTSVTAAITAQGLGAGSVLYIPKSVQKPWGGGSATGTTANPLIIVGDPYVTENDETVIEATVNNCSGVLFEHITFEWVSAPGTGAGRWAAQGGNDVTWYKCRTRGEHRTIDPNDGSDWENAQTFAYFGGGFRQSGLRCVAQECTAEKSHEAFELRGLLLDCTIGTYRDDGVIVQESSGGVVDNMTMVGQPSGNWLSTDHHDFIQTFGVNGLIHRLAVVNSLFSSEGFEMQGFFNQHSQWASTSTLSDMLHHWTIRNNVFLGGHWHVLYIERLYGAVVENNAFLLHPDTPAQTSYGATYFAAVRFNDTCTGTIRNNIVGKFDGTDYEPWRHLLTLENNVELDLTGTTDYTTVFPNWTNTLLSTLDRAQLSADWVAANPGIGPDMLQPGTTGVPIWSTQPSFTKDSYTVGEDVVLNEGAAGPSATISVEYFRLAGVDKSGELSGLTWPGAANAAETPGTITAKLRATNAGGFTLSNEVSASLVASAGEFTGLQPAATSISLGDGLTMTLSTALPWFTSANGDIVVISSQASSITGFSTPSAVDANGLQHSGAMKNPSLNADGAAVGDSRGRAQGWDEAIAIPSSRWEQVNYYDSLNVDPAVGGAIAISVGASFSIVKCIRDPNYSYPNGWKSVLRYKVVTVMGEVPPTSGTWFRPSASALTKSYPGRKEDMNFSGGVPSPLRNLPQPSGLSNPSSYLTQISNENTQVMPLWIGGAHGRSMWPSKEDPYHGYSGNAGRTRSKFICSLFIDQTGNASEQAAREELACTLIQWGIDTDGAHLRGDKHGGGAGQWWGIHDFYFLAAFMLGDAAMLERCKDHYSGNVHQFMPVSDFEVGYPALWDTGSDGGGNRRAQQVYRIEDKGKPEWIKIGWHKTPNATDMSGLSSLDLGDLNASLGGNYRDTTYTNTLIGILSIALLRHGPNGETGLDAIRAMNASLTPAVLRHADRTRTHYPINEANFGETFHDGASQNIYDLWRDEVESVVTPGAEARWTGVPDIWASHFNPVFQTGTGSGQIDWSLTDFSRGKTFQFATLPVDAREVSYSQDGVQFVDVSIGTATSHTLTGLRPGTPHWCRWRHRSSTAPAVAGVPAALQGWSRWSPTFFQRHPNYKDTNASRKAIMVSDRGKVTSSGSAPSGQAWSNVVAPAVCYKPYPEFEEPYYEAAPSDLGTAAVYGPTTTKVTKLYAGIGIWSGGDGNFSFTRNSDYVQTGQSGVAYQWQRNTVNISGATSQAFDIETEAAGAPIRCRITVGSVVVYTNTVTV